MDYKTLALVEAKATDAGAGTLEGYASVFASPGSSQVDSYGDQIAPGAYADTLADFVRDGFFAADHVWGASARIGTIKEAHEDNRGLYVVAEYHSNEQAQRLRNDAKERMDRGKTVQLSIGYEAQEWEYRKVDPPVRGMFGPTDQIRVLKKIRLFEISDVAVAADDNARATAIKVAGHRIPFEDHTEAVRVALAEYVARCRSGSEIRQAEGKVGRPISEARRSRMASVSEQVRSAADEIDAMLLETAPPKALDPLAEFARYQQFIARRNGVAV